MPYPRPLERPELWSADDLAYHTGSEFQDCAELYSALENDEWRDYCRAVSEQIRKERAL